MVPSKTQNPPQDKKKVRFCFKKYALKIKKSFFYYVMTQGVIFGGFLLDLLECVPAGFI